MTAPRHKLLPLLISAFISTRAGAVGFGDIELHSYLGKPLDAVIPLTHLDDLSNDQLRISLGSQDDYHALGVEFTYQHTLLKIEPVIKNGRGFVHIVTRDPIAEPYLNFVLNLRWPQGQVVREYTVLLDPPVENRAVVSAPAAIAPTALAAANVESAQSPLAESVVAPVSSASATQSSAATQPVRKSARTAAPNDAYTVRPGDSLWKLAAQWRRAGVGVEQMMGAIYSANPEAFVANDPARLKAAATLQMPSAEQIAAAQPMGRSSLAASAMPKLAADPAPAPTPEPLPVPAGTSGGTTAAPRDDELIAENATLKRQVSELSTNVAALNDNLASSQERLHDMEVKMGTLIDQLERQRITTQALANAAGVAPPQVESMVNQATAGDLLAPPPAHTPWWVHVSYSVAIAALGAWLAFTQLWPRRRAVLLADKAEPRSLIAREEIENRLVARVPAANSWNNPAEQENYWHHPGDASDLPLDLVAPDQVAPDTATLPATHHDGPTFADVTVTRTAEDAIDPTISAGVFAAFGRFDEAEQVLNEAIQREPDRIDLKLQLLDVYKHEDKREAFQNLADAIALDHADDDNTLHELATLRANYLG